MAFTAEDFWKAGESSSPSKDKVVAERGFFGDVRTGLLRGLTSFVETGAEAAEALGVENSVDEWAREKRRTSDWLAPDVSEALGREGFIKRSFSGALEALPQSVAPAVPGAVAGGMLAGPVGAAVGGLISMASYIGLGQGHRSYEEGISKGLSEEDAKLYGLKKGATEAGLETLAMGFDFATAGAGRLATSGGKAVLKELLSRGAKEYGKDIGKIMAVENLTEQAQLELGNRIDQAYGLSEGVTWKERLDTIGTTTMLSLMFGAGAVAYDANDKRKLKRQLESGSIEEQLAAAKTIKKQLEKQGETQMAQQWDTYVSAQLEAEKPLRIEEDFAEAATEAQRFGMSRDKAEDLYTEYEPKLPSKHIIGPPTEENINKIDEDLRKASIPLDDTVEAAQVPVTASTSILKKETEDILRAQVSPMEYQTIPEETIARRADVEAAITPQRETGQMGPQGIQRREELQAIQQEAQRQQKMRLRRPDDTLRSAVGTTEAEMVEPVAPADEVLRETAPGTAPAEMVEPGELVEGRVSGGAYVSPETTTEKVRRRVVAKAQPKIELTPEEIERAKEIIADPESQETDVIEAMDTLKKGGVPLEEAKSKKPKEETDKELQAVIERTEDPTAKALVEEDWKAVESAVEERFQEMKASAPEGTSVTRTRALNSILDDIAMETRDKELIDIIEANVQEYRSQAKERREKKAEKRRKKGINWVKQKGMRFGKDMAGKQYAIIEEGKGRQTLYVDNEVIGTFGSIEEAIRNIDTAQSPYKPEGNKKDGYRVLFNGEPLNTKAKLTKRAAVDVMSRLHAHFGNKLPIARLTSKLNKMKVEEMEQFEKSLRKGEVKFVDIDDVDAYLEEEYGYTDEMIETEYGWIPKSAVTEERQTTLVGSEDKYKKMYLEGVTETFRNLLDHVGIKTPNIVVVDFEYLKDHQTEAMRKLSGMSEYVRGQTYEGLESMVFKSRGLYGAAGYDVANNEILLVINPGKTKRLDSIAAAQVIAHESGHIMEKVLFHQAPQEVQDKIFQEYLDHLDKRVRPLYENQSVADLWRGMRPYHLSEGVIAILKTDGQSEALAKPAKGMAKDKLGYVTSFSEWFADNVAKWATTTKEPQTIVEKTFGRIGEQIKRMWKLLTNTLWRLEAAPSLKEFLDYHVEQTRIAEEFQMERTPEALTDIFSEHDFQLMASSERNRILGLADVASDSPGSLQALQDISVQQKAAKKGIVTGSIADMEKHFRDTKPTRTQRLSESASDFGKSMKKYFRSGIDIIGEYSPAIERYVNRNLKERNTRSVAMNRMVEPFMKAFGDLSEDKQMSVSVLLYNGHRDKIRKHYPEVYKTLGDVDKMLSELRKLGDPLGLNPDGRLNSDYFPRIVEDPSKLGQVLSGTEEGNWLANEVEAAKIRMEKNGIEWRPEIHEQEVYRSILQTGRFFGSLRKPGALKERKIKAITKEMMPHYALASDSIQQHMYSMIDAIGNQEIVGSKLMTKAVREANRMEAKLSKMAEGTPQYKRLYKDWVELLGRIESKDTDGILEESLVDWISEYGKGLSLEQQEEIMNIVRARMLETGMHGKLNTFRNISLATTLGDFVSTITQASEIVLNIYANRGDNALLGLLGKKEMSAVELGFKNILTEYQREGSAKWLSKLLDMTGFSKVDLTMKEAFMQGALNKARKQSKEQLKKEWGGYFGNDFDALYEELQEGKLGALSQELAWGKLMRYQPLDVIANPEAYATAGNKRILYMLKTFQLRQANALYREGLKKIISGNKVEGVKNLVWLTALIVAGGAGKDELRDLWLGREVPVEEHLWENLMNIGLLSRYDIDRFKTEGVGPQVIGKLIPPTPFIDYPLADFGRLIEGKPIKQSYKLVPVVGKWWYDRHTEVGKENELNRRKKYINQHARDAIRANDRGMMREARQRAREFNQMAPRDKRLDVEGTMKRERSTMRKEEMDRLVAGDLQGITGYSKGYAERVEELKSPLVRVLGQPGVEGFEMDPYIDGEGPKSGVTIGNGINLGYQSAQKLLSLGVASDTVDKLKGYLGKKGKDAERALKSGTLMLSPEEVIDISNRVTEDSANKIVRKIGRKQWDTYTDGQKAVAVSLYHIYDRKWFSHNSWLQWRTKNFVDLKSNMENYGDKTPGVAKGVNNRHRKMSQYL